MIGFAEDFFMRKTVTKTIARAGVIAALYFVLTLAVLPVASGAIQFRISEALTLLPLFFPEAIPALTVGCVLSNLTSGCVVYDVVFGSAVTCLAAVLTFLSGKLFKKTWIKIAVGGLFPVLLNAFLLPLIWLFCYENLDYAYMLQVLFLIVSQGVSVYVLGSFLVIPIVKLREKGVKCLL